MSFKRSNMQTSFATPFGTFCLKRYPLRKAETLQAWDAADELLLNYLADEELQDNLFSKKQQGELGISGTEGNLADDLGMALKTLNITQRFTNLSSSSNEASKHSDQPNLLIINDQFGSMSNALHQLQPSMLSDSYIAQQATLQNNRLNQLSPTTLINSTDSLTQKWDIVLIKVQKSLAQLEEQLFKIKPHIHPGTLIIGFAMVKMIHNSTLSLFEDIIGPTQTSLAKKKARLILCKPDPELAAKPNPYPQQYPLENTPYIISNHANVFSRSKLDIGSRFFLEHLPSSNQARTIIDLGCGNGIVGLIAAEKNPSATIDFYDESHMAVASAEDNFKRAFGSQRKASFNVADCLSSRDKNSADLILNNPPFHQQNAIGDFIAWQMFSQSFAVLKPKGELWVIGNRHLAYQQKLKKLFGQCEQVTSNKKFVILRAIKK